MTKHIGFLGLGKMGLPMARHLQTQGHTVTGYDPSAERRAAVAAAGMVVAPSVEAILAQCAVIVSSLPNDAALEATAAALVLHARPGTVYVGTSTVSIEASTRVAALLEQAELVYLRSTVSGNSVMAESAQLTIMVSGNRQAFDAAQDIFSCWGPTCFYLGSAEQARLMKLVINLMIMLTSGMLAEALTLGQKGGLAWDDMWKVITSSAVASPIIKAKAGPLARRDFSPTFTVEQMRKDVGLILNAGASLNVPLSLTALAAQWLTSASAQGGTEEDYAYVIKVVEQSAAVDFAVA
ncbi:MAG: NAD(P)-dependent oxidoreductase [Candidatus Saccharibacteria bacterium]|nr:NAD(P)-dependent oxidoreductase [Rhodoferax sp.]